MKFLKPHINIKYRLPANSDSDMGDFYNESNGLWFNYKKTLLGILQSDLLEHKIKGA